MMALRAQSLDDVIDQDPLEPDLKEPTKPPRLADGTFNETLKLSYDTELKAFKAQNLRFARAMIIIMNLLGRLNGNYNPRESWKTLHDYCVRNSASDIADLEIQPSSIFIENFDNMLDFINKKLKAFQKLKAAGKDVGEAGHIQSILLGIYKQHNLRMQFQLASLLPGNNINTIVQALIKEWEATNSSDKQAAMSATYNSNKKKPSKQCQICKLDHFIRDCPRFDPNYSKGKSRPKCTDCGRMGHLNNSCWKNGKGSPPPGFEVKKPKQEESLYSFHESRYAVATCQQSFFAADSGATRHVSNNINHFDPATIRELPAPISITTANNGSIVKATHEGSVKVKGIN